MAWLLLQQLTLEKFTSTTLTSGQLETFSKPDIALGCTFPAVISPDLTEI
jgi:hypothetical protein